MKKYNLSKIMKNAWSLKKEKSLTISESLKKAWAEAKAALSQKGDEKMADEKFEIFENSIGTRVELPIIVGVSDKQIQFARDLRRKYLAQGSAYSFKKWVEDTREYMSELDMDKLHNAAIADNISDAEAIDYLLRADCYTTYAFWVAISEPNAGKIIDTLKYAR